MRSQPAFRRLVLAVSFLTTSACRVSTSVDNSTLIATGDLPGVTSVLTGVSGGQEWWHTISIDSATGQYDDRQCVRGGSLDRCSVDVIRRTGSADRPVLADLFRLSASAGFRSLGARYGFGSGITPPDPQGVTLTIIANGRKQVVSYDPRAPLPAVLGQMDCRLRAATGSLINCAS